MPEGTEVVEQVPAQENEPQQRQHSNSAADNASTASPQETDGEEAAATASEVTEPTQASQQDQTQVNASHTSSRRMSQQSGAGALHGQEQQQDAPNPEPKELQPEQSTQHVASTSDHSNESQQEAEEEAGKEAGKEAEETDKKAGNE